MVNNTKKSISDAWRRFLLVSSSACLVLLTGAMVGCKEKVTMGIINRYPYPVTVYDATSSTPYKLGLIPPNSVYYAKLVHITDDEMYHFIVHKGNGPIIKEIREPSTQLNASLEDSNWNLVIAPTKGQ